MFQVTTSRRKRISKYSAGFVKRDPMLALIGSSFAWFPLKSHSWVSRSNSCRPRPLNIFKICMSVPRYMAVQTWQMKMVILLSKVLTWCTVSGIRFPAVARGGSPPAGESW